MVATEQMMRGLSQLGQVKVCDLDSAMGCPECLAWVVTGTRGRRECGHPTGYCPSVTNNTLRCANQHSILATDEF